MDRKDKLEIDLIDIVKLIWDKKIYILSFTFAVMLIASFVSLRMPNVYTSSMVLMLSQNQKDQGLQANSQLGALTSLAGLGSGNQDKSSYVMEKLKTKAFSNGLLKDPRFKINLLASIGYDEESNKIILNDDIYDSSEGKWKVKEPSQLEFHRNFIEKLRVTKTDGSGFIKVSFSHHSPYFSFEVLETILRELNEEERLLDITRSKSALDFLNSQLVQTPQVEVRNSINSLIENQLKTQMMANIDVNYLVRPLDNAFVPENKSSPRRTLIVLVSGFISALIAILYFFTGNILRRK